MARADELLATSLAGLPLQSPLIAAAGTCGYIEELPSVLDVACLGAITTKSITPEPRIGNDPIRMVDLPCGMLNAIGLANVGLDRFLEEKLPHAASVNTNVIASVAGGSTDDYTTIAAAFDKSEHLPAIELNVSCPNTGDGLEFGTDPQRLQELVAAVRTVVTQSKLIIKLSPNVTDIVAMAHAAIDGGADALTLTNTFHGMAIDVESRTPRLSRIKGGYSGPAVHPMVLRMVYDVYTQVGKPKDIPIIGLGGVMSWKDAAAIVLAGASAVGVGTMLFASPKHPAKLCKQLAAWVQRQGAKNIGELTGAMNQTSA